MNDILISIRMGADRMDIYKNYRYRFAFWPDHHPSTMWKVEDGCFCTMISNSYDYTCHSGFSLSPNGIKLIEAYVTWQLEIELLGGT